jgi:hypothetical protein
MIKKEIIGDDYPTYEQVVNEYHESKKLKKEENHLAELFSMESTLNTLICEYCSYVPTEEIGSQMLDLNNKLLKAMNARKKELGITEWWGYEDEPQPKSLLKYYTEKK